MNRTMWAAKKIRDWRETWATVLKWELGRDYDMVLVQDMQRTA